MQKPLLRDVFLHVKNKVEGLGVVEKVTFPATRWENVLGAPRLLDKDTIENAFPAEYALYTDDEIAISDEEYSACFGHITES